jgi:hypothetical protein
MELAVLSITLLFPEALVLEVLQMVAVVRAMAEAPDITGVLEVETAEVAGAEVAIPTHL